MLPLSSGPGLTESAQARSNQKHASLQLIRTFVSLEIYGYTPVACLYYMYMYL